MSADNQMVVAPHKGHWCTYMQLGDEPSAEDERGGYWFKEFDSRDEAIDYAAKVCSEEIVEYGMRVEGCASEAGESAPSASTNTQSTAIAQTADEMESFFVGSDYEKRTSI